MRNRTVILIIGAGIAVAVVWNAWALYSRTGSAPVPAAAAPVAQATQVPAMAPYDDIQASELHAMIGAGAPLALIAVQAADAPRIPGTAAVTTADGIAALSSLPADRSALIAVYSADGQESGKAADALVAAGYENVYNLIGGLGAWTAAGYATESGADGGPSADGSAN